MTQGQNADIRADAFPFHGHAHLPVLAASPEGAAFSESDARKLKRWGQTNKHVR